MKHRLFSICFIMLPMSLMAQSPMTWEDFVQWISSNQEVSNEEEWTNYFLSLEELHTHPLDINTATPEEMATIPFLTPMQIEDIQAYVSMDGPMKTLGELALINSIDELTRRILPLFVYVKEYGTAVPKEGKRKSIFADLSHQVDTRLDIPLYYRKGFMSPNGYVGDALYNRLRYTMDGRKIRASIHAEKDAGENFYDSFGGYIMLKDLGGKDGKGIVREVLLGDFRAGWGEGLVMSPRASNSKNSLFAGLGQGIRPMTSTTENTFLRGGAITLGGKIGKKKNIELQGSVLASFKNLDATLNTNGDVQTIVTNGYHRTTFERNKKNNTSATTIAANLQGRMKAKSGIYTLGATGYWEHYSRTLNPGTATYRKIYPNGEDFFVYGIHYGYSGYRLTISGETAYSQEKGGVATSARAQYQFTRNLRVGAMGRYFGYKYHSFHAATISEGSSVQNESGMMFHLEYIMHRNWTMIAWADLFHDTWPRYQMTHSSTGQEFSIGANGNYSKNGFSLRYQLKRKEYHDLMENHHRLKPQWTYTPNDKWKFQTTGNIHYVMVQNGSCGWSLSHLVQGNMLKDNRLRISVMAGYFSTPDYLSRVYIYEPSLWESTSTGTYSGKGLRSAVTIRYTTLSNHWMIEAKYGITHYTDRNTQSSSWQTIYSPTKQDISIQIRMKY